ncbi:amino acid ABC transporter substrate-binding protein [Pannus brasiliensis CCIBt3594]|uniref:Amino acid ABC transporter substrate-binding protein n=1 Tax=Pannus brasiliensis CCIBt3594 TaxID=1427578 RepID=A0AAW9QMK9_9CHRO
MKRIFATLWLILSFLYPANAGAETVLEKIYRTGLLEVGIREDAIPFGYRDSNHNLEGLCLDFVNILREELKRELNLNIISVKIYKSTLFNRFDLVENGTIDLECGPNTIRENLDRRVTFSRPFFVTGTQFLIRRENRANLNLNTLENIRIGVLRDTTTASLLREKYPNATLQEFQGATGRLRGVQALKRRNIDAFASDGILLLGEAIVLGLSLEEEYAIVPENPLDCEYYGLILPSDNPRWKELVNSVIIAAQNREVLRQWFGEIAPYFIETLNYCRNKS